jgi:hypothetical protein
LRHPGIRQKTACKRRRQAEANHPGHKGAARQSTTSYRCDQVSQLTLVHGVSLPGADSRSFEIAEVVLN